MSELKTCPFCGGKSATRRKVESKTRLKPSGRWEYGTYIDYAHRFGVQPFCKKCFAKLPYVWGEWHEEDGGEYGSKCRIWRYADKGELDEIRSRAIEAWNRRANDALERTYYAADLRRAFSDMMERLESRDRRANDA